MPFEFAAGMTLPGHFRPETVRRVVDYGHELAQLLGFEVVGEVFDADADAIRDAMELVYGGDELEEPEPDRARASRLDVVDERIRQIAEIADRCILRATGSRRESPLLPEGYEVYPNRLIGFYATCGKGCGPVYFAFARYPREAALIEPSSAHEWSAFADPNEHGAYRVSEAHFVQCHLRHVWLFRLVKKRFPFLRLCVRDDGEFWQKEDVDLLLGKVQVYAAFLNLVADNLRENGCEVVVLGEEVTPHQ